MTTIQKEMVKQVFRVFLSYAITDRVQAHKLRSLLSKRPNLRVFSTEMLSAGENWEPKLRDELSQCDIFLVLLSPSSVDSPWILHELGAAWALNKPIIPIVTRPGLFSKIPLELSGIQSVEIKDIEKPEVIDQLLEHYREEAASHSNEPD